MVTHLEPDILDYEIKWILGNITTNKANGGDVIPAELFKILKDDVSQWKKVKSFSHVRLFVTPWTVAY